MVSMNMAAIMGPGHQVFVYFDIQGIDVVLKDANDVTYAHFPASKPQFRNLLKKGVTVMACRGCLKTAGMTPADLAPGVEVADSKTFFGFTEGRIITLDY